MVGIPYYKISPGGNITAVVERITPSADYAGLANAIMERDKEVEQVCFLVKTHNPAADIGIVMMGGEFCANATRCAAFLHQRRGVIKVETLLKELVEVETSENEAKITVPGNLIQGVENADEGVIVLMEGINHLVTSSGRQASGLPDIETAKTACEKYCPGAAAFGMIYLDRSGSGYSMSPHIFVRETESFVHETACASGSMAAAAVLAANETRDGELTGNRVYEIKQPSGSVYTVELAVKDGAIQKISLKSGIQYLGIETL